MIGQRLTAGVGYQVKIKKSIAHACSICKIRRISVTYSCVPFNYDGYLCPDCAQLLVDMYQAVCTMIESVAKIKRLPGRKLHRVLEVVERLTSKEGGAEWAVEKLRM